MQMKIDPDLPEDLKQKVLNSYIEKSRLLLMAVIQGNYSMVSLIKGDLLFMEALYSVF